MRQPGAEILGTQTVTISGMLRGPVHIQVRTARGWQERTLCGGWPRPTPIPAQLADRTAETQGTCPVCFADE